MKKCLIYGYGVSGKSAEVLCRKLGYDVYIFDDDKKVYFQDIKKRLTFDSAIDMASEFSLVVTSPTISKDNYLIKYFKDKNITVVSEFELAYRNLKGDNITITGTNGKTTTVELLTHILKNACLDARAVGNNGVGFAKEVCDMDKSSIAVVEASSFQLDDIDMYNSKIAILLNIDFDHMEYHKTMKNYINAKLNIFKNQTENDKAVLNYDNDIVMENVKNIRSNIYYFSRKKRVKGSYLVGDNIFFSHGNVEEYITNTKEISIKGEHNIENALACITVAKLLNIPNSMIEKSLKSFEISKYRIELVHNIGGKKYFNDSKSTNSASTLSACNAMEGLTVLLMGGYDKGLSYRDLFDRLPLKVNTVIAYGANRESIINDTKGLCALTVIRANDLDEAIKIASKVECDNVLFSPGSSSFDMFTDYKMRGEYFNLKVKELACE